MAFTYSTIPQESKDALMSVPPFFDDYQLVTLKVQRVRMEEKLLAEKLQPVADVLYNKMSAMLDEPGTKERLFQKLKEVCGKEQFDASLRVPVFTFNTIFYNDSLEEVKKKEADIAPEDLYDYRAKQDAKKQARIDAGHEAVVYLDYASMYCGRSQNERIYRLLKKTDILERLAVKMGPNFRFRLSTSYVPLHNAKKWSTYPATVYLEFFPKDQPEFMIKKLGAVALKYKDYIPLYPVCRTEVKGLTLAPALWPAA